MLVISLLVTQVSVAEIDAARQDELLYLLKHDCGSCHGMTLKGGLGPALLPETLAGKPESYLVTTILEGRENTAMPPWKSMLSRDEAIWLVEQLQSGRLIKTALVKNQLDQNNSSRKEQ
ncbi:MAG: cytochrome c [Gammaproteobacteria bacterium]|nr:cytochrome c [Gammaproteobacteria bacterium]